MARRRVAHCASFRYALHLLSSSVPAQCVGPGFDRERSAANRVRGIISWPELFPFPSWFPRGFNSVASAYISPAITRKSVLNGIQSFHQLCRHVRREPHWADGSGVPTRRAAPFDTPRGSGLPSRVGPRVRGTARRLGVGRTLLLLRHLRLMGLQRTVEMEVTKRLLLPLAVNAPPTSTGVDGPEIHMILCHRDLYRGLWALYSLHHFSPGSFRLKIHDDGTLDAQDRCLLERIFPGLVIVPRAVADATVVQRLEAQGLTRCAEARRRFFWALKLFDPAVLSDEASFCLIDSDVLFFSSPRELFNGGTQPQAMYLVDQENSYSLSRPELRQLLGQECLERCNSGLIRLAPDLRRIEAYLAHNSFWVGDDSIHSYKEQTLYAMELTASNAAPLPGSYAMPPLAGKSWAYTAVHYCGGPLSSHLYFAEGLHYLARRFDLPLTSPDLSP